MNTVPASIPAFLHREGSATRDRSIGAILIDAGRLAPKTPSAILRLQKEEGLRFGDAAIKLGLLTEADIDYALSSQFDYPYLHARRQPASARSWSPPTTPSARRSKRCARCAASSCCAGSTARPSARRWPSSAPVAAKGAASSPPTSPSSSRSSASTPC